eukprot:gene2859-3758_t
MAMELFKTKAQLSMLHVPYRGTAGYTQDMLSGELMVGFLPVHIAQGFVTAGKLTALAVGSPKRHPVSPAVATFEELGVKGVEVDLWYAFFAPAKTPAPVIARLNTEVVSILKLPEIRDLLGRAGMDAAASTTEELGALSVKDYPRWGEVIRPAMVAACRIAVVGGGIAGLGFALALQQRGLLCDVYETVPEVRELGVGITLLPHAMRELAALGLQ